jgi:hypothetical protein
VKYQGTYNGATVYGIGAVVSGIAPHGAGSSFISLTEPNVAHEPGNNPASEPYWGLLSQAGH